MTKHSSDRLKERVGYLGLPDPIMIKLTKHLKRLSLTTHGNCVMKVMDLDEYDLGLKEDTDIWVIFTYGRLVTLFRRDKSQEPPKHYYPDWRIEEQLITSWENYDY